MKDTTIIIPACIVSVTIIEIYALHNNVDGQILSGDVGGITGLTGISSGGERNKPKEFFSLQKYING